MQIKDLIENDFPKWHGIDQRKSTPTLERMTPAPAPMTPAHLKLPIGIQNLREIREQGYYYADKSGHAVNLFEAGKYYFLSRPRRFGKSLLLDTFKELFEGNQSLFQGLPSSTPNPAFWPF